MSRYFAALETFKVEHHDEVIKYWKTEKAFDKIIKQFRKKEKQIARDAIKTYGSIDRYTDAMIENLGHLSEVVDELIRNAQIL
jgi:Mg2+ and Co2+ transporter CorA